jgi:hypothetical protein
LAFRLTPFQKSKCGLFAWQRYPVKDSEIEYPTNLGGWGCLTSHGRHARSGGSKIVCGRERGIARKSAGEAEGDIKRGCGRERGTAREGA